MQHTVHASDIEPGVHDRVQRAVAVHHKLRRCSKPASARQAHVGDALVNVEDGLSRAFLLTGVCLVSAAQASLASCRVNTGLGPHQEEGHNFLDTP